MTALTQHESHCQLPRASNVPWSRQNVRGLAAWVNPRRHETHSVTCSKVFHVNPPSQRVDRGSPKSGADLARKMAVNGECRGPWSRLSLTSAALSIALINACSGRSHSSMSGISGDATGVGAALILVGGANPKNEPIGSDSGLTAAALLRSHW